MTDQITGTPRTFLVIGGSGSGKSAFAQRLAARCGEPVLYLATGRAEGPEMAWRVRQHQQARPETWRTVEAQRALAAALDAALEDGGAEIRTVLLEDVGSLVGACLPHVDEHDGELTAPHRAITTAQAAVDEELDAVFEWCTRRRRHLVVVTSEVGLGLLPTTPVGRLYKDVIGAANQALAARVDRAYLVVAGLVTDLTQSSRLVDDGFGGAPR